MACNCKGSCKFDPRRRTRGGGTSPYDKGWKGCSRCDCMWEINNLRCPCCNGILRISPGIHVVSDTRPDRRPRID